MTEPVWLRIARGYLGQREMAGRKHNPLILRWWARIRAPFAVSADLKWAISPDKAQAIVVFAVAAVGLVHVLFPESGNVGA